MIINGVVNACGLFLLMVAVVFTGCAQSDNTTATVQPPLPVDLGQPIIVYQRSGGLSGMEDTLRIYSGGSCELVSNNGRNYRCQIISLKLKDLDQAFVEAGFFDLPGEYRGNPQADAIRYQITYMANGNKHQVVAYSNSVPDRLLPVIRELDQCVMLVSTTIPR